jgi:prepilin-type N-terminal cleavage/methylation domain-containing protein
MKNRNRRSGFTLIEMLTVIAVILVLSGLLISVNSGVQTKAARSRAEGEIAAMSAACENYKADNGAYPRDAAGVTDLLDPRITSVATTGYAGASLELYKALSGNTVAAGGALTLGPGKSYYEFKPYQLNGTKSASTGLMTAVFFIQDPWGKSYGYSTAGALYEETYRTLLLNSPAAAPPSPERGYNPTFDLWSTGGASNTSNIARCVKNW